MCGGVGAAAHPGLSRGELQDRAAGLQPPGHTGRKAAGQCCAPRWGWAGVPAAGSRRDQTSGWAHARCALSASGLLISSGVMGAPAPPGGGGEKTG